MPIRKRGEYDYLGVLGEYVTFPSLATLVFDRAQTGGSIFVEAPVTIKSGGVDKTGGAALLSGQAILGKLILLEQDGAANVQVKGFMRFRYDGAFTAAMVGQPIVSGAVESTVRVPAPAVPAEVVAASGKIVVEWPVGGGVSDVWVLF